MREEPTVFYFSLFLTLVVTVLFLSSIIYWYQFYGLHPNSNQTVPPKAVQKSIEIEAIESQTKLDLGFRAQTEPVLINQEKAVEIYLKAGGKEIWGADLVLEFNPKQLAIKQVAVGDYFQEPIVFENSVSQEEGKLKFSTGSLTATRGEGILTILQVKPVIAGQTTLSFSPETEVVVKDQEKPWPVIFSNLSFTVSGST